MIIAVVVVISLVVVGLVITQVGNSSDVSGTSSEIKQKVGVSGLSLGSSVAGVDGNGLLVIKNIDVGNLTLTKIVVDGINYNYSAQIVAGDQKSFKLKSISSCVGKNKNYSVKVEYVSASGLTKTADFGNIPLDCTSVATPVGVAVEQKIDCTGGTITYLGGYTIHTFLVSGTLTCPSSLTAEVLVVAGGGGGSSRFGGGGGAGGLIYYDSYSINGSVINVIIGTGGTGNTNGGGLYDGTNGGNSTFGSLVAIGGGAGRSTSGNGFNGGSGGGIQEGGRTPGQGTGGQGNNGGTTVGVLYVGSGGGGAGSTGGSTGAKSSPTRYTGDGGSGLSYSISGTSVTYACGGGGGAYQGLGVGGEGGAGGSGSVSGGKGGGTTAGSAGTANTGTGGGGGSQSNGGYNGGSGIVIVRYLTN